MTILFSTLATNIAKLVHSVLKSNTLIKVNGRNKN